MPKNSDTFAKFSVADHCMMMRAFSIAVKQLGSTGPNPSVGCVIVKDGEIVGEGATGTGGHPHAEQSVLEEAGEAVRGGVAYVTLEPCAARSNGDPGCAKRLIDAEVERVVIANRDPHEVASGGIEMLQDAGIKTECGLLDEIAHTLVDGFFHRLKTGLPLVVLSNSKSGFDAEVKLRPNEAPLEALKRLSRDGNNRVFIRPSAAERDMFDREDLINQWYAPVKLI